MGSLGTVAVNQLQDLSLHINKNLLKSKKNKMATNQICLTPTIQNDQNKSQTKLKDNNILYNIICNSAFQNNEINQYFIRWCLPPKQ